LRVSPRVAAFAAAAGRALAMSEAEQVADRTGSIGGDGSMAGTAQTGDFDATAPQMQLLTLNVHGGGAHTGVAPPGCEELDTHVLDAAPRARITAEEKLQREVLRKRQMEAERRARIFDAKVRTIGIDKETLDRQVAEKNERKKAQAELDKLEDRQFMGLNRLMQIKETDKNRARAEAERAAKEYSLQHLNFEKRDVFDLNDPKALSKATPLRCGDEDPRFGPSSAQQFNGEDLHKQERIRQQKLQYVHTLEQQVFEKHMLKKMDEGGDEEYQRRAQEVIDACNAIDNDAQDTRKAIMEQYKADLLASMEARADAKSQEQMDNQAQNQREFDFHASDPFLQEDRPHVMENGRALAGEYKGSTRDERVEVFAEQLQQCDHNAAKKAYEGSMEMARHRANEMSRKQLLLLEREKQRMKRAMAMEVSAHNRGMHQSQRDALAVSGRDGHKNQIHPSFFEQFGTGTR